MHHSHPIASAFGVLLDGSWTVPDFIDVAHMGAAVSAAQVLVTTAMAKEGERMQAFVKSASRASTRTALTYLASEKIIPGYGGGMSSAKAALESDTQVLAYEAGRKYGIRVNTISAGPLGSRAAKAIGFIDDMINYSMSNAPLSEKPLSAMEIGQTAAFLCSPLASGITGSLVYVDNGLHAMGLAPDAQSLQRDD